MSLSFCGGLRDGLRDSLRDGLECNVNLGFPACKEHASADARRARSVDHVLFQVV